MGRILGQDQLHQVRLLQFEGDQEDRSCWHIRIKELGLDQGAVGPDALDRCGCHKSGVGGHDRRCVFATVGDGQFVGVVGKVVNNRGRDTVGDRGVQIVTADQGIERRVPGDGGGVGAGPIIDDLQAGLAVLELVGHQGDLVKGVAELE